MYCIGYPAWANPYVDNFSYRLDAEMNKIIREYKIDLWKVLYKNKVRKNLIKAIIRCRKEAQKYAMTKEAMEVQILIRLLALCTDKELELLRTWFGDYLVRLPGTITYEYVWL